MLIYDNGLGDIGQDRRRSVGDNKCVFDTVRVCNIISRIYLYSHRVSPRLDSI